MFYTSGGGWCQPRYLLCASVTLCTRVCSRRRVCLLAVVVGVRDCVRRWWWRRRQRYQRLLTQLGHHQRPGPEAPIRRHAEAHSHRLRMLPKRRPGDAGGWWRRWWRGRRRRQPRVGRQPALRRRLWLHLHVRGGGHVLVLFVFLVSCVTNSPPPYARRSGTRHRVGQPPCRAAALQATPSPWPPRSVGQAACLATLSPWGAACSTPATVRPRGASASQVLLLTSMPCCPPQVLA